MTLFRMRASTLLLLALPPCLRASWPEGKVHQWHQEIRDAMSALYRIEKQMNETWVDPRAELEDLEVKEEL